MVLLFLNPFNYKLFEICGTTLKGTAEKKIRETLFSSSTYLFKSVFVLKKSLKRLNRTLHDQLWKVVGVHNCQLKMISKRRYV